ncbi:MAG TPA: PilN domain-containing protein [Patescibacteria group bacterium]|nr:PilN domain-containing protein [Patescibacteria group bacterium]
MPAKKKSKIAQINLLPREGLGATTSGRVLLWILTTFRMVLIITELVVIFAFLSRFWLDAKNTDLTDEVNDSKAVILSLSDFEKDFKGTQEKLAIYDLYKQGKGFLLDGIIEAVAYKPDEVFFESVDSNSEKVTVKGVSISETGIHQYLANLKSSDKFESVKLDALAVDENQTFFRFSIVSYYKKL